MKVFTPSLIAIALFSLMAKNVAASEQNSSISVSPEEKAKIEQVVHDYLINKPEVLVEAMQVLQKKQMDQTQATVKQTQQIASTFANALFHQADDPVSGNPNGKITLVEFFDYQCPHCIDMTPAVDGVIKANPDLRVVYKEFPIRGPISEFASRAALAANKQGKYVEFSHALLSTTQPLTEDTILEIAKKTGLDISKLKKDMDSKGIKDKVQHTIDLAQKLKLFGTPALFIGKTNATDKDTINYVPGQVDQKQLQNLINQANK